MCLPEFVYHGEKHVNTVDVFTRVFCHDKNIYTLNILSHILYHAIKQLNTVDVLP